MYRKGFLKVLNLRMLAPPSRLVLTVGAWFVSRGIFKSFEFAGVGSAVGAGFENRGLVSQRVSRSSQFAGVGSAVVSALIIGACFVLRGI